MKTKHIDALQLKEMFIAGANHLTANKEIIDDLNVFPVPDGDTGTNMSLTVQAAARELEKMDEPDLSSLARALSTGALMGARGNSGVILSQIFRGFSSVIGDAEEIDVKVLDDALTHATEVAYKSVIKPVEGTMLTIINALSEASGEAVNNNYDYIEDFFDYIFTRGNEALLKTTEQLPVLKQAGVVDAGGKGLLFILEGALAWLKGVEQVHVNYKPTQGVYDHLHSTPEAAEDIIYPYCTEFIIQGENLEKEAIQNDLLQMPGDSLVVVVQDDIAKIHMHTENPGKLLDYGIGLGILDEIKVDNMRTQYEQHKVVTDPMKADNWGENPKAAKERKTFGFVSVSSGEGLEEISRSMGIDVVIQGGQTMNPSTEEIAEGIRQVNADTVYVLPNNKNIIMAAEQASHVIEEQDIIVIPTKSFPQGMASLISFDPEAGPADNREAMIEALDEVKSGEITYAVRDTELEGQTISEGSILGIYEGKILITGDNVHEVTRDLLFRMEEGEEICTLYYGEDIKEEEAKKLAGEIEDAFEDIEVEVYYGGQPLYYYLVSLE